MLNPYLLHYKDQYLCEEYENQRKQQQRKFNQLIGWSIIGFQAVQWIKLSLNGYTSTQDFPLIILTCMTVLLCLYGFYSNQKNSLKAIKYFFISTISLNSQFVCSSYTDYFLYQKQISMLLQGWIFGYSFIIQMLVLPSWYQKLLIITQATTILAIKISTLAEPSSQDTQFAELILVSFLIIALFYLYEKYEKQNFQNLYEQKKSLQEWKNLLNFTISSSIFVIVPEQPNKHKLRFWNQTFHEKFGQIENNEFFNIIQKIAIKEHKFCGQSKKGSFTQSQKDNKNHSQSNTDLQKNIVIENAENNEFHPNSSFKSSKNYKHIHPNSSSSSSSVNSQGQGSFASSSSNLLKKIDLIYQQLKQNRMNEQEKDQNVNTIKSFCPQIEEKYHNCLFKYSVVLNKDQEQQQQEYNNKYKGDCNNQYNKQVNNNSKKSQETTTKENTTKVNINQYYDIKLIGCYWDNQDAVMVIMDDISEKIINERLKETDEYKDQMLATVTHDLKTPLNGIIIMIKTLIESSQHTEEEMKVMKMVLQNANLLLSMIQDILDYSQIKRNVLNLAPDRFKIEEVLEEVYELFSIQAQEKGLELRIVKDGVLCNNQSSYQNSNQIQYQNNFNLQIQSPQGSKLISYFRNQNRQKTIGYKIQHLNNNEDQQGSHDSSIKFFRNTKKKLSEFYIRATSQNNSSNNDSSSVLIKQNKKNSPKKNETDNKGAGILPHNHQKQINLLENELKDSIIDNSKQDSVYSSQYGGVMNNKEVESEAEITLDHKSELIEQFNLNDENTKQEEQSYATYLDQKKYNPRFQNQSSNLLKFSIDLMSSGKNNTEVYSDKRRIKQILINLVGNALKFTERGSISIEYNVISDRNLVEIVVRDTGVGISESLQPKLFKVYSTFDHNNGSNRHGVGLGLAICKKLAQQLGPEKNIKLTSTKGDGSSFSFLIYQDIGLAIKKYKQKLNTYSEDEESQQINDQVVEKQQLKNSQSKDIMENQDKQQKLDDIDGVANLKTKCEISPNLTAITSDQVYELNTNYTNRLKKNLSIVCPKVSFEDYTLISNSQRQLVNDKNNLDNLNEFLKNQDKEKEGNNIQSHRNSKYNSHNNTEIGQMSYQQKKFQSKDENYQFGSELQLEQSCIFDSLDIDEHKTDQKQAVIQFQHQLGMINDQVNKNIKQKYSLNKISQQSSMYLQGRDIKNFQSSTFSAFIQQNEQNSPQNTKNYRQNQSVQQFDQFLTLKQNVQNSDTLSSPKSCLTFYNFSNFKGLPLNEQQQSQQAKVFDSGLKITRTNSQSIPSVQLTFQQSQKHNSKISNSQSSLHYQHQSYIYEFKRPVNILIVDDTTFNLIALKAMLKKVRNINLIVDAYNGKEALEKFKQNKFDLVLMDINMPIMDGQESMRHMRSYEKEQYYKSQKRYNSKHSSYYSPLQKLNSSRNEEGTFTQYQQSIIYGEVSDNQIAETNDDFTSKYKKVINLCQNQDQQNQIGISEIQNRNIQDQNAQKQENAQTNKQPTFQGLSPAYSNSPLNRKGQILKQGQRQSRRIKTATIEESPRAIFENGSPGLNQQLMLQKQIQGHIQTSSQSFSRNNLNSGNNSKVYWNAIIFAVTAYDQQQDIQKYLQAGANAHISKPIKLENLFSVINKFF
ncbi:ATPase, histidine kinase-, DNA gyrase B (macronuclear) [Tetrahymena thermophila SB210]|uniref:histidine kinase n=1 Tax=Tetrahymena thermophila (strain SB210) TaxID=312017 RepID=I7LWS5_TETTS|nr:ATPase, histidine kinase-, DNA gyrase B [Tetrahymena thermophila SB210]EAS02764.1 ATPase, histidine kinase-, DNA gyrase B [Tetrahymena thermophila SB210]|eukprot:XP_001023009.1 ATPase, histidine kinase-, DNA gyrase B [Tetrahymena thermophila SB210]